MLYSNSKLYLILILFFVLLSCKDNPFVTTLENAPNIPELTDSWIEVIFYDHFPREEYHNPDYENAKNAELYAISSHVFISDIQLYQWRTNMAEGDTLIVNEDNWIWKLRSRTIYPFYSSFSLIATFDGKNNHWDKYAHGGLFSTQTDSILIIEGKTSLDEQKREWILYDYSREAGTMYKHISLSWKAKNQNTTIVFDKFNEAGFLEGTFLYTKDESIHRIEHQKEIPDDEDHVFNQGVIIEWDEVTKSGFFITKENGEKKCWDSSFRNTSC